MNIEKTILHAVKSLKNSNIKNPYLDSELLLSKVIKKDRKYMILNSKKKLNFRYLENFNNLVSRRRRGEPVAYLTNSKECFGSTTSSTNPCIIKSGSSNKCALLIKLVFS